MKFIDLKTKSEVDFLSCPTVLCVGDFDGVHLGHRQLVATVLSKTEELKSKYTDIAGGAWFFESNLYKSTDEIYSVSEKLDVFASLGLDYAVIADFEEMRSLSPESFVNDVLKNTCRCVHAVCGENFRFGARASGSPDMLLRLMQEEASIVPLLSTEDRIISSTYIRSLLLSGDIEKANYLLCNNYSITETVVHGKALGRRLGIPTINQNIKSKNLILKNGIYSTVCTVGAKKYFGVTNIGIRPTVENTDRKNIETFIIDFDGDCYEKDVKIEFIARVRDEMRFDSVDAMKNQIAKDIITTKEYFNI